MLAEDELADLGCSYKLNKYISYSIFIEEITFIPNPKQYKMIDSNKFRVSFNTAERRSFLQSDSQWV